ncbi:MAG: HAMP domain-containing histidine kinase [Bacteroidetes bacterium]|nr:HAMP domain-containing histidine kinase [Bacteroidota bacterium]MBP7398721.1 HAMP domain-containing histidine kinase [Chitinophagales bacterium]MBK7109055.1 HAMP domain-containing histidine kinase [Bacteroidota bacterium]MBK8488624.1 HAMP domain-containing histidine kinase [Bacteroidota bacterium]MBK8681615.1 HAMP domain-containing histidine kinase [Bacteroidota bacterium]
MRFKYKYGLFFLIVFIYIISSFAWWMYILQNNNRENYRALIAKDQAEYIMRGNSADDFLDTDVFEEIHSDYMRKQYMLMGEGVIFITLIALGFIRIRNTFQEEIQLTQQQNNFLLSITHELKSPLASLKLSMQTLHKHNLETQKVQRLATISLDDIDRLEALVENILLASKMDSSNFMWDTDAVNISELIKEITNRFLNKYKDERKFIIEIQEDIYVNGDRFSLTSVFNNLLENAYKYSRLHATIAVKLFSNDHHCTCIVSDTGIGIDEKEKLKIFDRFYRIGREETRSTKGTGLGLFIVKQVVLIHKGTIQVSNNTPVGTVFEIQLPLVS